MGLIQRFVERVRPRPDRGLIFNVYQRGPEGAEFVGLLVTEHDRCPQPIVFIPFAGTYPALSIERRLERLALFAERVASDHQVALCPPHSFWTVRLDDLRCELADDDARVGMLMSFMLLPMSVMPDHFSPLENWYAFYLPGPVSKATNWKPEGPLGFFIADADAMARTQKKSGTSEAPIVPTPAKHLGQKALETTAA